ncbi:DUF1206 domain-containing protein [Brevibacterium sp. ZH18]|uniref:DUF1206 domain-containing protein n=1 Tax=Brevibacterium sp. ZH18 TaxID=2927784 RepID=UPI001F624C6B|nr:DUF1206 domain-containing protein [Brevibacterium sp. ZH18]MCI4013033.1 DUF1206 domain-containing protein [Brevibacterium sp. ZH18]
MDETDKIKRAADSADDAAQEAADSKWFERVARAGFVANGIVHIILGATAVAVGFGRGGEADQSGAIQQMAAQPFGMVLIVLCLIGCGLMALWCVFNAFFGSASLRGAGTNDPQHRQGRRRWVEFVKTIGSAVAYAAVALTFSQYIIGGGSDSGKTSSQASTTLAKAPGGLYILAAIGAVIVMIGIGFCISGIRGRWKNDLRMPRKRAMRLLLIATGVIGYLGKGATLLAVGALVVVSAMTGDPEEFTGIDGALKAMRDQPFGTVLMLAVGAGLVLYGVFLSLRSRYDRMD